MSDPSDKWSEEKIKFLGYLWNDEKLSNSKIAARMNKEFPGHSYNKNMIAGKRNWMNYNIVSRQTYDICLAHGGIKNPREQAWLINSETDVKEFPPDFMEDLQSQSESKEPAAQQPVPSAQHLPFPQQPAPKSEPEPAPEPELEPAPPATFIVKPAEPKAKTPSSVFAKTMRERIAEQSVSKPSGQNEIRIEKTKKVGDSKISAGDLCLLKDIGVGVVTGIAEEEMAGYKLFLVHIRPVFSDAPYQKSTTSKKPLHQFYKTTSKMPSVKDVGAAFSILQEKKHTEKGVWTKRALALEEKIDSMNVKAIAEVIRDTLKIGSDNKEPSYSEMEIGAKAQRILAEVLSLQSGKDVNIVSAQIDELIKKDRKKELPWHLEEKTHLDDKEFVKRLGYKKGELPIKQTANNVQSVGRGSVYSL